MSMADVAQRLQGIYPEARIDANECTRKDTGHPNATEQFTSKCEAQIFIHLVANTPEELVDKAMVARRKYQQQIIDDRELANTED